MWQMPAMFGSHPLACPLTSSAWLHKQQTSWITEGREGGILITSLIPQRSTFIYQKLRKQIMINATATAQILLEHKHINWIFSRKQEGDITADTQRGWTCIYRIMKVMYCCLGMLWQSDVNGRGAVLIVWLSGWGEAGPLLGEPEKHDLHGSSRLTTAYLKRSTENVT